MGKRLRRAAATFAQRRAPIAVQATARYAHQPSTSAPGNTRNVGMTTTANSTIVCASPDGRQRVTLDLAQQTATFEGCYQSRSFLSFGNQPVHVCPFTDLRAAHDFLSGEHGGAGLRTVLKLGQATGVHPVDEPLGSVFISTATGRCRVFAHWHNFAEFRAALREIVKDSPGGHWSDNPRLMPVYAVIIVLVVGGIVGFLL